VISHVNNLWKEYGLSLVEKTRKPLKEGLLLKGLKRGNLNAFCPHPSPPIPAGLSSNKHEGDAKIKD
jgi:hypothetical protein